MTTRTLFPTTNTTSRVRNEVDRLFDNSVMPTTTLGRTASFGTLADTTVPAINLCEDVACLYCEIELPGVPASNIDIQIIGNELIIRGFGLLPVPTTATVVRNERGTLRFERSILLPCPVLVNDIVAVVNNGVLLVVLPKVDAITGFNTGMINHGLNTGMINTGLTTGMINTGLNTGLNTGMINGVFGRTHGVHGLGMNTIAGQCPMTQVHPTTVPFAGTQGCYTQGMFNGMTQNAVQPVMVRVAA